MSETDSLGNPLEQATTADSSFPSSKEEPKPEPTEEKPTPPPEVEKVAAVAATPQHWAKLKGTEDHVLAAICAGNKWDEHFIVTEGQYEEAVEAWLAHEFH